MALKHDFSKTLKEKMKKLFRKDQRRYEILIKKIESIAGSNENTIERFKNLRHEMKGIKRVHIDRNFVLTFKYDKTMQFILFLDFDHHDNIYRK